MTTARLLRVYRPKAERTSSAAKAAIAAARPRDARGHFLPVAALVVALGEDRSEGDPVALGGAEAVCAGFSG